MEKADILEMTVKYLRSLNADTPVHVQKQQGIKIASHAIHLSTSLRATMGLLASSKNQTSKIKY